MIDIRWEFQTEKEVKLESWEKVSEAYCESHSKCIRSQTKNLFPLGINNEDRETAMWLKKLLWKPSKWKYKWDWNFY